MVHAFDTMGELVLTPPLGLVYLPAGSHENVMITLDANLLAEYGYGNTEKNVLPMVHVDSNANQTYEFPEGPDVPVMVNDEMVVAPLELSQPTMDAPAVTVSGDITLDVSGKGLNVTVPSVALAQPGFATLHAVDAAGELMVLPVLGVSNFLEAGTHEHVQVWVMEDQAATVGDAVFVMLHHDDGDMTYMFPESDPPVTVDGAIVMEPATLR